ncbi:MAG: peptide chain release factor N(5)-glutamine methyltransferase [Lachnospiraceae bacterium]|nr:peptide chain release factor N(5)-glutamine methyltransferase [Lachnospiraceae bacterium]
MKVRDLLRDAEAKLTEAGVPNAAYDARIMLEEAYGKTSAELLMELDRSLCPGATGGTEPAGGQQCPGDCGAMLTYRASVSQRLRRVPLQQIIGHAGFMGLDFKVNRHVLVPRQDTETLVETVLETEKDKDIRLLDLCTGSGCIAISLKYYGGYRDVTMSDKDRDALHVAIRNASIQKTEIRAVQSDLFEAFQENPAEGREAERFDVIVSNPPYIRSDVIETLDPEVRDHDPWIALDGGADGLDFYRRILKEARGHLVPGGRIWLEIGYDQAEDVVGIAQENGYTGVTVRKDLAGLDRVVGATLL